jgi:glycine dehydrogenase
MLGGQGLVDSSKIALLNANYMAHRLSGHFGLRYKNANGRVAHELLIDFAEFDKLAGLKVTDFAKRLQVSGLNSSQEWRLTCVIYLRTTVFTLQLSHGPSLRVCLSNQQNPKP